MRKDLLTHFIYFFAFFLLITLARGWFNLDYAAFWIGGVIGTLLPDIDHLLYVYYLKPQETTSQKVTEMISQGDTRQGLNILASTQNERKGLIFHSAHFQLIFIAFAVLILTSTGSLLARGVVVAFLLHLLVDQAGDLFERKNIDHWFNKIPVVLDAEQKRWFFILFALVVIVFGFFF
jgi:hypothetical protein